MTGVQTCALPILYKFTLIPLLHNIKNNFYFFIITLHYIILFLYDKYKGTGIIWDLIKHKNHRSDLIKKKKIEPLLEKERKHVVGGGKKVIVW